MRLSFRSILAFTVCFVVLSFLVLEVVLGDVSAGHSLAAVYVGVGILCLILISGRSWPNIFGRDMFDEHYKRQPSPVRPDPEAGSSKSHRSFASSAGGHVARSVGHLQQLVGHGAGSRQRLLLG
jgi:hypothetical protein